MRSYWEIPVEEAPAYSAGIAPLLQQPSGSGHRVPSNIHPAGGSAPRGGGGAVAVAAAAAASLVVRTTPDGSSRAPLYAAAAALAAGAQLPAGQIQPPAAGRGVSTQR